jgi:hypothetical protein
LKDFHNLKELSRILESALLREQKGLKVGPEAKILSKEDKAKLHGSYRSDFEKVFLRISRYSLFVAIMAATEVNLQRLCKWISDVLDVPPFKKKKRTGDIYTAIMKYLQEECRISMLGSVQLALSENVDKFRQIRNCIVHEDGRIPNPDIFDLASYRRSIPTLAVIPERDASSRIVLQKGFIDLSIHILQQFALGLFNSCKEKTAGTT